MVDAIPSKEIDNWIKGHLFNAVPMGIAIIDREFDIVYANSAFEDVFGSWQNRKCYKIYKNLDTACPDCKSAQAFKDGTCNISHHVGYDKNGQMTQYINHTTPIVDAVGNISYIAIMTTDITESEQIRVEYELLFDQVPCNILLIDRNFRIIKINNRMREMLGDLEGKYCYKSLKGLEHKCNECTARQTFADGQLHTGHHIWKSKTGRIIDMHVITVPLALEDKSFNMVMEMAVDITQTLSLEDRLRFAHKFLETVVATSIDGLFAINEKGKITIFNPAARRFFGVDNDQIISREDLALMLPKGFLAKVSKGSEHVYLPETKVQTIGGDKFPVRLVGNQLLLEDKHLGMAFSVQDLRPIKKLEKEKLEAERLAAVGHTVAGLAHGVKNLITALEGGMYMLKSGLSKGDVSRLQKGMDMLYRNINRISMFVKAFLNFSKGREIQAQLNNPAEIAQEVVELYAAKAEELGIELKNEQIRDIKPAVIDYESMHECLTNLIGNAIDACRVSENKKGCRVIVRTYERDNIINYEVIDNGCGMDYEVKKKVFTSFFTTKGLGGTGLGLLMTKKTVQEHGGTIKVTSKPNQGTSFRIRLPRKRLPKLMGN